MVFARVVGYLLIELFERKEVLDPTPCKSVRDSILSESRQASPAAHSVVFKMGREYRDHLIRACAFDFFPYIVQFLKIFAVRQSPMGYPEPSQHPSRPAFDNIEAMVNDIIQADGKDYRTVRKKVRASTCYILHPPSCQIRFSRVTDFGAWSQVYTTTCP